MLDRKAQLGQELMAAHTEALAALAALAPAQLDRPSANGDWTAKDTLAHLSSIEPRLQAMCQHALEGRTWPADDPGLDAYNGRAVAERDTWPADRLLAEFQRNGEPTRAFLERLPAHELDRAWTHPIRGAVTIESLLQIVPRHIREHIHQIHAAAPE